MSECYTTPEFARMVAESFHKSLDGCNGPISTCYKIEDLSDGGKKFYFKCLECGKTFPCEGN